MAVQWIGSLSDAELLDYLPQLVQVGRPAFPPFLMIPSPGPTSVCIVLVGPRVPRIVAGVD